VIFILAVVKATNKGEFSILSLLERATSWQLNKVRPTWCHLLYYFTIYCSTCFEC
jgi:hypothetical protein